MSKRYQGGFLSASRQGTTGGSTGAGSAPGIWEMETVGRAVATGAWPLAGNWIDDVFSSTLYTGTGASGQTVTTGVDITSKGGMVWTKARNIAYNHGVFDTARGAANILWTDLTNAQQNLSNSLQSFTSTGFTTGGYASTGAAQTYVAWTFREQPKFFDVVTYTATGSAQTINHNLGSTPGCIIVKNTSANGSWFVWHTSLGNINGLRLQSTAAAADISGGGSPFIYNVSSTSFTVGAGMGLTDTGNTYVAYLFAHDAGGFGTAGTDNVISCGTFTGQTTVTLGWEPQWIMRKRIDLSGDWFIHDTMRGFPVNNSGGTAETAFLNPNLAAAESTTTNRIFPSATGFTTGSGLAGETYIYIAIRRAMKPPTTGTSVYYGLSREGTSTNTTVTGSPFPVDLAIIKNRFNQDGMPSNGFFFDRLRGRLNAILSNATDAASSAYTGSLTGFDVQNGYTLGNETSGWVNYAGASNGALYMNWMFRRAPGFLDIVQYTGTGAVRTVAHGLGAVPELIITKPLSGTGNWATYAAPVGPGSWLRLESTLGPTANTTTWNNTAPTATVFSLGTGNQANFNGYTFIAYLFGSLPGVSQVGSYTGTGATLNINCGFTGGARFVLIKRTNAAGAWYVFDTTRGIVAGNEVYMMLNDTGRDVSSDWIAPLSSGFQLTSGGSATVNVNGGTYIFLAIA